MRVFVLLSCLLFACGEETSARTLLSVDALATMPRDGLVAYGHELERAMREAGIGPEAVSARLEGAALARVLASRLDDPAWLARGRAYLAIAAADGSDVAAQCRAVGMLVALERDDLGDIDAARATLERARIDISPPVCDAELDALATSLSVGETADDTVGAALDTRDATLVSSVGAPIDAPAARRGLRVILLDPGHGGDEHGARVDGVRESHLVLDITRRAAMLLSRALPETRILMTRQDDTDITLEERAAMARSVDADLFVSVHLNDAEVPVETGGITTFVLDTTGDEAAIRLAARENGTRTVEVTGMQRLLAGLHREQQAVASRALADVVHASLLGRARREIPRLPDRGVKSAMFYVLVGAEMPAILVEASFMSRPEELEQLRTIRYRQALAEGIASGIVRYAHAL
jgi:N-acetylmuramoyl-L-alanine amidase